MLTQRQLLQRWRSMRYEFAITWVLTRPANYSRIRVEREPAPNLWIVLQGRSNIKKRVTRSTCIRNDEYETDIVRKYTGI